MKTLALKCSVRVCAGIVPNEPVEELTREWSFTQEDLKNPPIYVDQTGAAMNYAMSLQNPTKVNWVRLDWIWY